MISIQFNKSILLLLIAFLPAIAQAKPACYQVQVAAEPTSGAPAFTATLWLQDTTEIADEVQVKSGDKQATLALWCRDMETEKCSVDASPKKLKVKQSKDGSEI